MRAIEREADLKKKKKEELVLCYFNMCELIFVFIEKSFESYDLGFHHFVQAK